MHAIGFDREKYLALQSHHIDARRRQFGGKNANASGLIRHGAELNDMELDDLLASMIEAMRSIAPDREEWLKNHPEQ